jgi:hypothetical protein
MNPWAPVGTSIDWSRGASATGNGWFASFRLLRWAVAELDRITLRKPEHKVRHSFSLPFSNVVLLHSQVCGVEAASYGV